MNLTKQQTNALCGIATNAKHDSLRCINVCENGLFVTDSYMLCAVTDAPTIGEIVGVIPESQFPLIKAAKVLSIGEQWRTEAFENAFYFEDARHRMSARTCNNLFSQFEQNPCGVSNMDVSLLEKALKVFKAFNTFPDIATENGGLRLLAQTRELKISAVIMGRKVR